MEAQAKAEQENAAAGSSPLMSPDQEEEARANAIAGTLEQYVSFTVGDEEYAVDIMRVREIKGWTEVTVLPNQPPHMRGVLNLRGTIVPIIDLRCRFGQGTTEATPIHVVVIVALGERVIGVLVDTVSDILSLAANEIRPVPELDSRDDQDFLEGLATTGQRMVAILALDRLVGTQDLEPGLSGPNAE